MKKSFMMLAALPLLLAACGEDDSVTVTPSNAEIKCGETVTLSASSKDVTWSSLDADIASVDNKGVVTGNHVGQTRIEAADKDGNNGSSEITVIASNNNFKAPLLTWGLTEEAIKKSMESWNLQIEETGEQNTVTYSTAGDFPMYSYAFDEKEGMLSAALGVSTDMDEKLGLEGWLDERYWYQSETEDGDFLYYDAKDETSATMAIVYGYDPDNDYVYVVWTPISNTKAGDMTGAAKKAALKALHAAIVK